MRKRRTAARFLSAAAWLGMNAIAMLSLGCEKTSTTDAPTRMRPAPLAASATQTANPSAPFQGVMPAAPDKALALRQALGVGTSSAIEAQADTPPDPKEMIAGTLTLPAAQRARVARGDVIFLSARRTGAPPGPGGMLAVQKLQAEDFPMPFALGARDAMIPGTSFDGPITITARVDKDGDALTRRKGDVYGEVKGVRVGTQNVSLALDTVQAEDRTIATPEDVRKAMMPPGHP